MVECMLIPLEEVMCLFDADRRAPRQLFHTLLRVDSGAFAFASTVTTAFAF
jgi:hypothetical protein